MNKLFTLLFFNLFVISCCANDTIPNISSILSKEYSYKYSITEYLYDSNGSPIPAKTFEGVIQRDSNEVFSLNPEIIGISTDTTVFVLRKPQKSIDVGPNRMIGSALFSPFYDPLALANYAIEKKATINIKSKKDTIYYNFYFPNSLKSAANEISFSFEHNELSGNKAFNIQFMYQRMGLKVLDIIYYTPSLKIPENKIEDFLEKENDDFKLREEYKDYHFTNFFHY